MEPLLDPEHRDLEEALLRAGREVGMSPELRAKTLAALGVASAGVGLAATAKAGAWGWLTTKTGALWGGVLGSLGLAGAVVVSSQLMQGPQPPEKPPAQAVEQAARGSSATPSHPEVDVQGSPDGRDAARGVLPPPDDVRPENAPSESTERVVAPAQREPAGRDGARSTLLREEISHISRVERALRAGNQGEALSLLNTYRARFPRPQLGLEAEVLTIQALYESGSVGVAQNRARSFLQRHPTSPLGARAKRYLRE